jgi:hypothetical protein
MVSAIKAFKSRAQMVKAIEGAKSDEQKKIEADAKRMKEEDRKRASDVAQSQKEGAKQILFGLLTGASASPASASASSVMFLFFLNQIHFTFYFF